MIYTKPMSSGSNMTRQVELLKSIEYFGSLLEGAVNEFKSIKDAELYKELKTNSKLPLTHIASMIVNAQFEIHKGSVLHNIFVVLHGAMVDVTKDLIEKVKLKNDDNKIIDLLKKLTTAIHTHLIVSGDDGSSDNAIKKVDFSKLELDLIQALSGIADGDGANKQEHATNLLEYIIVFAIHVYATPWGLVPHTYLPDITKSIDYAGIWKSIGVEERKEIKDILTNKTMKWNDGIGSKIKKEVMPFFIWCAEKLVNGITSVTGNNAIHALSEMNHVKQTIVDIPNSDIFKDHWAYINSSICNQSLHGGCETTMQTCATNQSMCTSKSCSGAGCSGLPPSTCGDGKIKCISSERKHIIDFISNTREHSFIDWFKGGSVIAKAIITCEFRVNETRAGNELYKLLSEVLQNTGINGLGISFEHATIQNIFSTLISPHYEQIEFLKPDKLYSIFAEPILLKALIAPIMSFGIGLDIDHYMSNLKEPSARKCIIDDFYLDDKYRHLRLISKIGYGRQNTSYVADENRTIITERDMIIETNKTLDSITESLTKSPETKDTTTNIWLDWFTSARTNMIGKFPPHNIFNISYNNDKESTRHEIDFIVAPTYNYGRNTRPPTGVVGMASNRMVNYGGFIRKIKITKSPGDNAISQADEVEDEDIINIVHYLLNTTDLLNATFEQVGKIWYIILLDCHARTIIFELGGDKMDELVKIQESLIEEIDKERITLEMASGMRYIMDWVRNTQLANALVSVVKGARSAAVSALSGVTHTSTSIMKGLANLTHLRSSSGVSEQDKATKSQRKTFEFKQTIYRPKQLLSLRNELDKIDGKIIYVNKGASHENDAYMIAEIVTDIKHRSPQTDATKSSIRGTYDVTSDYNMTQLVVPKQTMFTHAIGDIYNKNVVGFVPSLIQRYIVVTLRSDIDESVEKAITDDLANVESRTKIFTAEYGNAPIPAIQKVDFEKQKTETLMLKDEILTEYRRIYALDDQEQLRKLVNKDWQLKALYYAGVADRVADRAGRVVQVGKEVVQVPGKVAQATKDAVQKTGNMLSNTLQKTKANVTQATNDATQATKDAVEKTGSMFTNALGMAKKQACKIGEACQKTYKSMVDMDDVFDGFGGRFHRGKKTHKIRKYVPDRKRTIKQGRTPVLKKKRRTRRKMISISPTIV